MKITTAIWILVAGFMFDFLGTFMKITHQALADETLLGATVLKMAGGLLTIWLLLRHPKVREFLDNDEHRDSFK